MGLTQEGYIGSPAPLSCPVNRGPIYIIFFSTQLVGGLLMLANSSVSFGVLLLGQVLVNILSFHIFMAPTKISLALVATALWFVLFFRAHSAFSGVFVQKGSASNRAGRRLRVRGGR